MKKKFVSLLPKGLADMIKDAVAFMRDPEARIVSEYKYPNGNAMSVRDAKMQGLSRYYTKDKAGIYHYQNHNIGQVFTAVGIALRERPNGPAYFWFNDTFCPIVPNDTEESLLVRWEEWRDEYQKGSNFLLKTIRKFSE